MKSRKTSMNASGLSSCGMCPHLGRMRSSQFNNLASVRELLAGTMTSFSPWTIRIFAPLSTRAFTASSRSNVEGCVVARARAMASRQISRGELAATTEAKTTRNIPTSQSRTTDGLRYPSIQSLAIASTREGSIAARKPFVQNSLLRTSLRKRRMRNGFTAHVRHHAAVAAAAPTAANATRTNVGSERAASSPASFFLSLPPIIAGATRTT